MIHNPAKNFQDIFRRYLDNQSEDFKHVQGFPVKTITFVVTEDCNLRCSYCYECGKNYNKVMDKEMARKAVDKILNQNTIRKYIDPNGEVRAVILDFIGGEPLLQIDLIDYICDYFKYQVFKQNHQFQNYMFSMTTNGVLYDDPQVQRFIQKNRQRLSLTITIDGKKELHDACRLFPDGKGSFDTVYRNIQLAVREQGLRATKVTIAPDNLPYLAESIIWLIEDIGLTDIAANPVFEDVWEGHHARQYHKQLMILADWFLLDKRYENCSCTLFTQTIGRPMPPQDNHNWCGGNGLMLAIGTDGNLYPCIRYMNYSLQNQSELKIGSLNNGIASCKEEKQILDELSSITRRSQSTDECINCPVASGCAWCSGYNYDVFGTPNKRATFICKMHKARVLANYYYWNKVYELEGLNKRFELHLPQNDINFITDGKGVEKV